ncbi:IS66 family transposase [Mesorhizobium sp. M0598]
MLASPQARLAARREHSAPVIAALKPWFEKQLSMISSGSGLAEDIRHGLGHWQGLTRFLDDGRLELDTNPVENAIRPVCLTRKKCPVCRSRSRGRKLGAARLHRHLQAQRPQPGRLPRRNPRRHHQRPSADPDRGTHALAIPKNVKPKSTGDPRGAHPKFYH